MPRIDIARRLAQILTDMKSINSQLAEVNAQWADPPDPDKPAIRAQLDEVKVQAASVARLADGMLARLG